MKRFLCLLTLLLPLLCTAALAEPLTLGDLPEAFAPFFPADRFGDAVFQVDDDWDEWSDYFVQTFGTPWTIYPIAVERQGETALYLFDVSRDEVTLMVQRQPCFPGLPGMKLSRVSYWKRSGERFEDADGALCGDDVDLHFSGDGDLWDIQYTFYDTLRGSERAWELRSVCYQLDPPERTPRQRKPYDTVCISLVPGALCYGYSYQEEPLAETLVLPWDGDPRLEAFDPGTIRHDPQLLMTQAVVTTGGGALNLRAEPAKTGKKTAVIPNGASLLAWPTSSNGWTLVKYNDLYGYVMTRYLDFPAQ